MNDLIALIDSLHSSPANPNVFVYAVQLSGFEAQTRPQA
jgi:hypothetical protein